MRVKKVLLNFFDPQRGIARMPLRCVCVLINQMNVMVFAQLATVTMIAMMIPPM